MKQFQFSLTKSEAKKHSREEENKKGLKGIKRSVLVNGLSGESIIQTETLFQFFFCVRF